VCWRSRSRLRGGGGELEGHGRGALVPKGHRLDAGKDFPLVAGQRHAHVQQVPEQRGTDH